MSGDWTGQSRRMVTKVQVEHLKQELPLNCNLTLREMTALLYYRFNVRVSFKSVCWAKVKPATPSTRRTRTTNIATQHR
ncbi:hypothetical protein PybrP1_000656 [[Pythium] brassicae (nom. inval.)]|nr:hypothetical protein PybrP1_000656 [[Pythium] brassicae (nom. inval.)]